MDETSDSFLSGTVNIQVIQIADDLVMTSNVLSGPSVEELPTVDAWLPSGEITRAYIESALNVLQSVKTRASTSSDLQKLIFPINALSSELEDLQSQIQQIVDNPTQSVTLTTTDGQTLTLNSATLVVLDRLVAGFVTQLVEQIPSDLTGTAKLEVTNIIMKRAASSCPTSTYDSPFIDEFICERQQYGENLYRAGQQAVKTGAKLEIGASLSVLGGFAGVVASAAEVSSLAFQSLWTAASGYITAYATSDPVPTPYKTLSDVGLNLIASTSGVLSSVKTALELCKTYDDIVSQQSETQEAPEQPQGGIIVSSSSSSDLPQGTHEVIVIEGSGDDLISYTVQIPDTQTTISVDAEEEPDDEDEEEPPPSGYCGDGICDANLGESTDTCPGDCPLTCGDGFCNIAGGELYSCPKDCPQNQCCIDTDGCPSETPYECPGACCCCPYGQVCCWTEVGWVCCGG